MIISQEKGIVIISPGLKRHMEQRIAIITGDVRYDSNRLQKLVKDVDIVLHLAAQVAVATSVENPGKTLKLTQVALLMFWRLFESMEIIHLVNW